MEDKRAYSVDQFAALGLNTDSYRFNNEEGIFTGLLTIKAWGKSRNLRCFFRFDDGREIISSVINTEQYLGLADIPMGTRVELTYTKKRSGNVRLTGIRVIGEAACPLG